METQDSAPVEVQCKKQLIDSISTYFTDTYAILSLFCHDDDLTRIAKNQLSLAFELTTKVIQKNLIPQDEFNKLVD